MAWGGWIAQWNTLARHRVRTRPRRADGSEVQVLNSISLSIGQNGLAIVYIGVKFQLPEKFPKKGGNLGEKNRIKSQTPWRCKSIIQGSDIRVLFDSQEEEITVA